MVANFRSQYETLLFKSLRALVIIGTVGGIVNFIVCIIIFVKLKDSSHVSIKDIDVGKVTDASNTGGPVNTPVFTLPPSLQETLQETSNGTESS